MYRSVAFGRSPIASQRFPFYLPGKELYHSIWDKSDFQQIFENNKKWVHKHLEEDPDYFKKLKMGQKPRYLFIGCSDSRVPANEIMGLSAGDVFVHRNVANLVVNGDMNLLSVLQYSVEVLKVRDVIVCGHYGCGGVKAASTIGTDHGLLEHWLRNIKDVIRVHQDELNTIEDEEKRHERLVELSVQEQCINLFANPIVQRSQVTHGYPRIHGFVYDIGNGYLRELEIDFKKEVSKLKDIYSHYDFSKIPGNEDPK